jgi:hypothetical protein
MRPRKAHSGAINAKRLKKVPTHGLGGGRTRARTWDPMIKSYIQVSYRLLVSAIYPEIIGNLSYLVIRSFTAFYL